MAKKLLCYLKQKYKNCKGGYDFFSEKQQKRHPLVKS